MSRWLVVILVSLVFRDAYAQTDYIANTTTSNQKTLLGVPSAKEMVEQGNDLHQTDAKLLEKIEELTLHTIQLEQTDQQQQETFQQQQAEIDELKQAVKQLVNKRK